jgi:hypothetical protein
LIDGKDSFKTIFTSEVYYKDFGNISRKQANRLKNDFYDMGNFKSKSDTEENFLGPILYREEENPNKQNKLNEIIANYLMKRVYENTGINLLEYLKLNSESIAILNTEMDNYDSKRNNILRDIK